MNNNDDNIIVNEEDGNGGNADLALVHQPSSDLRKKETLTLGDDMSMNIELRNQNEFINMDHFDEASKIGFGINDYDNERSRIKVLSNPINGHTVYNKKSNHKEVERDNDGGNGDDDDEEEEEDNEYLDIKQGRLRRNSNKSHTVDYFEFPIQYLNNRISQYHQLNNLNTFAKFLKGKMPYYVSEPELIDEFLYKKSSNRTNANTKPLIANNNGNKTHNHFNSQSNTQDLKIANNNFSSAYYSQRELLISPNANASKTQLATTKSLMNFTSSSNPNCNDPKLIEKENIDLKDRIANITNQIQSLQSSNGKKNKELQKKNDKLTLYLDKYDSLIKENEALKTKIENMQIDINIESNDSNKKTDRLNELLSKINALDQEHRDLLKKAELEYTIMRETKQNYELFKGNYIEIKNQYDLLTIKYQSISDENFNYKRDLLLYEKEVKNKNEMIDKLRNNLLDNAKSALNGDSNMYSVLETNNSTNANANGASKSHSKSPSPNRKNNFFKNTKGNHSTNNPNANNKSLDKGGDIGLNKKEEKKNLTKTQQMKLIENNISKLNKEREDINNELNKLPEHPKKKNVIEQKKAMESKIEQLGSDLAKLRLEIKKLKEEEDN